MKVSVGFRRRLFFAYTGLFKLFALSSLSQAAEAAKPDGLARNPTKVLLVLGDSLSAEYGLPQGTGWVALLSKKLAENHPHWQVQNASVSGDTTAGGRSRLSLLLKKHTPQLVVIELGGNDALRGLPLNMTQRNLQDMVDLARTMGAKVLLIGMKMPPNFGLDYSQQFTGIFQQVAQKSRAALVPFMLEKISEPAAERMWFQSDRIHPNEKAQPLLLAHIWPELVKLL